MYLRVSLTDRCNLRCTYCLAPDATFARERCSTRELMRLVELVHATVGIGKIRFTGGEPTLCDDLVDHVAHAAGLVPTVGLTSNGVLLEGLLPALRAAGLTRLNISLDAVDEVGFRRHSRRAGLGRVVASIRAARRLGFAPLRMNAVALPDSDPAALLAFALREAVELRFIELMAIGPARGEHARRLVTAADLRDRLWKAGYSLAATPEADAPTARMWRVIDPDGADHGPRLGFITTASAPFCATCDRLRLSSQGRLHTCLFDERGHDLVTDLRRGDEGAVQARIRAAVAGKAPPASFQRATAMASIGG